MGNMAVKLLGAYILAAGGEGNGVALPISAWPR